MNSKVIETPCIGVCTLGEDGHCMGCMRTLQEITHWLNLSDQQRQAVLDDLPERLDRMFS